MPAGGGGGLDAVLRIWIRGLGPGIRFPLVRDPRSGTDIVWVLDCVPRILDSGSRTCTLENLLTTCGQKTQHFLENVLLPSFVTLVPESGIRDLRSGMGRGWCPDPESGIWDEHPGFATLLV
jgi:hypothetical protein